MAGEYVEFVNNSQPALNEDNLNLMQQRIKQDIQGAVSGDTLPIGCILPFGSDIMPENWLLCNGQAVSRTTYSDLFSVIGISYGQGDGFTTFNLPNLKGKVVVGKDENDTDFDMLGETGGEKTHTLTIAELPRHKHLTVGNFGGTSGDKHLPQFTYKGADWNDGDVDENAQYTGGNQAHNILQPYQVQNYIIKAKQSAGVVATVVDNLNSTSTTDALSANQGRELNSKFDYSNNEKEIGTWIDGKPYYEKVINFGALPNNTVKSELHNISNLKRIIKLEGFAGSSQNNGGITLPHGSDTNPIALFADDTQVSVLTTIDDTAYTSTYIYIYYTKTTD